MSGGLVVANDPLNATDPTGECPWCIGAGIGVLIEGASILIDVHNGRDVSLAEAALRLGSGALTGAVGGGLISGAGKIFVGQSIKASAGRAGWAAVSSGYATAQNVVNRAIIQEGVGNEPTNVTAESAAYEIGASMIGGAAGQFAGETMGALIQMDGRAAIATGRTASIAESAIGMLTQGGTTVASPWSESQLDQFQANETAYQTGSIDWTAFQATSCRIADDCDAR